VTTGVVGEEAEVVEEAVAEEAVAVMH